MANGWQNYVNVGLTCYMTCQNPFVITLDIYIIFLLCEFFVDYIATLLLWSIQVILIEMEVRSVTILDSVHMPTCFHEFNPDVYCCDKLHYLTNYLHLAIEVTNPN